MVGMEVLFGALMVLFGSFAAIAYLLGLDKPPEKAPDVEDRDRCPFCGARTAALDYHMTRCAKRPRITHRRAFEPGERID